MCRRAPRALRLCECSRQGPVQFVQSLAERARRQSVRTRPIRERHASTVVFQQAVVATVIDLHQARGPAAVCRRVRTIVVDAIQFVAPWARSHVANERAEAPSPLGAHVNAAPAIERERFVGRVRAADFSGLPLPIFARVGRAMRDLRGPDELGFPAATAFRLWQIAAGDNVITAARTAASPMPARAAWWSRRPGDDGQASEDMAGQVSRPHVRIISEALWA